MTVSKHDLEELLSVLRIQFAKVQERKAWLDLMHSEFKSGDELSFHSLIQAKEQLIIEQSVLSGHAFMVQQEILSTGFKSDPETLQLLNSILHNTPRYFD